MVEASNASGSPRRRIWLWVGIVVAIAAAVAIIASFALASGSGGGTGPSAGPSSSAAPTASSDGADPSATNSPATPDPAATSGTMPELAPVAPDAPADNGEGLVARITSMKAVEGEAVQAGEIGGPAVQFMLTITNGTDEAVDLGFISVNAYIGEARTPAGGLVRPGGAPFEGTLEAGESAEGVYVYTIPEDQRSDVTLTIDYRAGQPAFVFRGPVG